MDAEFGCDAFSMSTFEQSVVVALDFSISGFCLFDKCCKMELTKIYHIIYPINWTYKKARQISPGFLPVKKACRPAAGVAAPGTSGPRPFPMTRSSYGRPRKKRVGGSAGLILCIGVLKTDRLAWKNALHLRPGRGTIP